MKARLVFATLTAVAASASAVAMAADPRTTRIETAPSYGATVTVEEGVRVFRPLPAETHVIVNPNGQTPLGLNYYTGGTGGDPNVVPVTPVHPR